MLVVLDQNKRYVSTLHLPTPEDYQRSDVVEVEDPGFLLRTDYCYIDGVWQQIPETIDPWINIRNRRDRLLQESDWTQLPDVNIPEKEAWAIYRQALRDITDQPDPNNIVWPSHPPI